MNSNKYKLQKFTNLSILPTEILIEIFSYLKFHDVQKLYEIYPDITLRSGVLKDHYDTFKKNHLKIIDVLNCIKSELDYYIELKLKSLKETNFLTHRVQRILITKTCDKILELMEKYEEHYDSEYVAMEKYFVGRQRLHEEINEILHAALLKKNLNSNQK